MSFRRILRLVNRHAINRLAIASMHKSGDALVQALADAFQRTLSGTLDEFERTAVDRIEARRTALLQRTDYVEEIDYGAGDPSSPPRPLGALAINSVRVTDACRQYSRSGPSSMLLFNIVRTCKSERGLELGACMGLSAAYQAAAMQCNGRGQLITIEGAPTFAGIAAETLRSLELAEIAAVEVGPFRNTIETVLQRLKPLDYAFIDGHHDEVATLEYFSQIIPFLAERSVLVFDDIRWSGGMIRAWEKIRRDPAVAVAVTLSNMGVCVMGGSMRRQYSLVLA